MIDPYTIVETITGLVIFEIAIQEFCIDIKEVSAIINPNELDPSSINESTKGSQINIDNLNIPLIDFHQFFGFKKREKTKFTRILVIEPENKRAGFFVERIKEIITIDKEFKNESLKFTPTKDKMFLKGIFDYEGRKLFLPDLHKIIAKMSINNN